MESESVRISVEPMTPKDLDRVVEIENESHQSPWSRRAFMSEVTENPVARYYVVRQSGQIVGYVGMWVILDEAHITNIAVTPSRRRQGIARTMLVSMFQEALNMGATRMTLEVRLSNTGAQTLYRELGFVDRGRRVGYYSDTNEDAIIMWKEDLAPAPPLEDRLKWMM